MSQTMQFRCSYGSLLPHTGYMWIWIGLALVAWTGLATVTAVLVARILAAADFEEEWIELLGAERDAGRPPLVY